MPSGIDIFAAFAHLVGLSSRISKLFKEVHAQEMLQEFNSALLDLQNKAMAANAEYEKLAKVKGELEAQLIARDQWDAQAARYELKEAAPGLFVYALKPNAPGTEPMHAVCPSCFDQRKRSILQTPSSDGPYYVCHQCGLELRKQA